MKNSIYFKYCVNKRLLDLLGIKKEEILKVNTFHLDIVFERYDKKYKIDINTTWENDELKLQLSNYSENRDLLPHLFRLEGVTTEEHFAKFRKLLSEYVVDTKVYKCEEERK